MGIRDFFDSRFFEHSWKNKVFILQVVTITIAFILGIAKVATKPSGIPMTRSDIMAITMVGYHTDSLTCIFRLILRGFAESQILRLPCLRIRHPKSGQVQKIRKSQSKCNSEHHGHRLLGGGDGVGIQHGYQSMHRCKLCTWYHSWPGSAGRCVSCFASYSSRNWLTLRRFVNFWAAVIAWKDHKYFKRNGVRRGYGSEK